MERAHACVYIYALRESDTRAARAYRLTPCGEEVQPAAGKSPGPRAPKRAHLSDDLPIYFCARAHEALQCSCRVRLRIQSADAPNEKLQGSLDFHSLTCVCLSVCIEFERERKFLFMKSKRQRISALKISFNHWKVGKLPFLPR